MEVKQKEQQTRFEEELKLFKDASQFLSFAESIEFPMNEEEAKILINYMEENDYLLAGINGALYRGDLDYEDDNVLWEEYRIDDIVDLVCEWNYEKLEEMEARLESCSMEEEHMEYQKNYDDLKQEEVIIDQLFDRTMYGRAMQNTAEQIAKKFLHALTEKETNPEMIITEEISAYHEKQGNRR